MNNDQPKQKENTFKVNTYLKTSPLPTHTHTTNQKLAYTIMKY